MLARLLGSWKLQRTISDSVTGKLTYTAQGTADFNVIHAHALHGVVVQQDWTLVALYHEHGELIDVNTQVELPFTRQYVYTEDNNAQMSIWYVDQELDGKYQVRFFHDVLPENEPAEHLCGDDLYKGTFRFIEDAEFVLEYQVQGPKKNFTISTTFMKTCC